MLYSPNALNIDKQIRTKQTENPRYVADWQINWAQSKCFRRWGVTATRIFCPSCWAFKTTMFCVSEILSCLLLLKYNVNSICSILGSEFLSVSCILLVFWFLMGWDGVHLVLRLLFGLLYQPQTIDDNDDDCGASGGMRIGRGNHSSWRKPAPV
jgi:hypothetical protein